MQNCHINHILFCILTSCCQKDKFLDLRKSPKATTFKFDELSVYKVLYEENSHGAFERIIVILAWIYSSYQTLGISPSTSIFGLETYHKSLVSWISIPVDEEVQVVSVSRNKLGVNYCIFSMICVSFFVSLEVLGRSQKKALPLKWDSLVNAFLEYVLLLPKTFGEQHFRHQMFRDDSISSKPSAKLHPQFFFLNMLVRSINSMAGSMWKLSFQEHFVLCHKIYMDKK